MQEFLRGYLEVHGYWVLFLWTFLEGEAGLILAGFLAFQGYLNIYGVMVTSFCGAVLGDQFYFYLGRYKGKFLLAHSHALVRKLRKGLRLIERYGNFVAFISRYTYGFRIVLPIILGMTPFPGRRFFWLNVVSAIIWSIVFALVGFMFGTVASLVVDDVSHYEHHLMGILVSLIILMWLAHFVHDWWRRRPARARLKRMKEDRLSERKFSDE